MGFYRWERIVAAARKAPSSRAFVDEAVLDAPEHRVREWLADLLMQEIRKADRAVVREIEHHSVQRQEAAPIATTPEPVLASALGMTVEEYREWKAGQSAREAEARARWEADNRRREQESAARRAAAWGRVEQIIEDWKADLRVEWTKELLDSEIALPDGTRVTWGAASREQLSVRASMFEKNALANMEGAAFVRSALDRLDEFGATCLNETVAAAA